MAMKKQRGRKAAAGRQGDPGRLELAMRAINEGVYDWDVAANRIHYSEGVYTVLKMPRSMKTPAGWRARIHPDDLAAYDAAIVAHFRKKTRRLECDYRFRARDGTWRWARQRGVAVRDKRGRAIRMIGSIADISELKQAEEARRQSDERYDAAMRAINEGVYEWNIADGSTYYSERVKAAVGLSLRNAADWHKRIHPEDRPRYDAALVAHFKGRTDRFECDFRYRAADGSWRWARQHGVAVRDDKGRVIRLIGSTGDITALKRAEEEVRRAHEETAAALEQQTAISEILQLIAAAPGDLRPVYAAILGKTTLLCQSSIAALFLYDGTVLTNAAHHGTTPEFGTWLDRMRSAPSRTTTTRRAALERTVVHVHDLLADPSYTLQPREMYEHEGVRTVLSVPMLREAKLVGVITTWRREVRPFTERQVALVKTIADQAVIAIENVRLFNETREALERQTATAEILGVIAASPTDTKPVFDAISRSGMRLLGAAQAGILLRRDSQVELVGHSRGATDDLPEAVRLLPLDPSKNFPSQVILERKILHIPDWESADILEHERNVARAYGVKACLQVPLLRQGEGIGAIVVSREVAGPFHDKDIALMQSFADQAVIAIENVRLFNETREALERQTATAEILKVIARSPSDVQPVFDAIVGSCRRLFGGHVVGLTLVVDGKIVPQAAAGDASVKELPPWPLDRGSATGACVLDGRTINIGDVQETVETYPRMKDLSIRLGYRSGLWVPLRREGGVIGCIAVVRRPTGAFTDQEVHLAETFASQAVIAIENVRLFNETREALERQTATAEILNVIASSPADVQPVFDAIAKSAYRLIGGFSTAVARVFDDVLHLVAFSSTDEAGNEALKHAFPMPVSRSKAARTGEPVSISDTDALPESAASMRMLARTRGFRSILIVPMLREGLAIGTISVTRREPADFSNHQIDLLKTFADQAVIAIENVRLFNETKEALERQTATAEILRVISGSPTDTQPVFEAIVQSGLKLFSGASVGIGIVEGNELCVVAAGGSVGAPPKGIRLPVKRESAAGTCVIEKRLVNIRDTEAPDAPPLAREHGRNLGIRSMSHAPMFREGEVIGTIGVLRGEPGGLDDKQLALLKTFADQAVIAIENVRLFNETKESLEQQTATAEILRAISASPTDTGPVLDTIAATALRLFAGAATAISLVQGGRIELGAAAGMDEAHVQALRASFPRPLGLESTVNHVVERGAVVHHPDVTAADVPAYTRNTTASAGVRALLGVPMLREGKPIGGIFLSRAQAGPFGDKQIALLQTFAAQAVIAIENVRLFNETREALERQTATSEVLRVISQSQTDTQPVFNAIVRSAVQLCAGTFGSMVRVDDDTLRLWAHHNYTPEILALANKRYPAPVSEQSLVGLSVRTGEIVHAPDTRNDDRSRKTPYTQALDIRAQLTVPLLKDGRAIGTINVLRNVPGPFTDEQITLLRTFADQAVIAIENVRLFNETKEALERQTATAEILQVISGSPTKVQPVFDTIVRNGRALCGGTTASLFGFDGEMITVLANDQVNEAAAESLRKLFPRPVDLSGVTGRAIATRAVVNIPDVTVDEGYKYGAIAQEIGYRAILAVPMLREAQPIGVIVVTRAQPGAFEARYVELLKTFADQAVIAIENVRLFNETREALERQTATAEILRVIASSPSDVQPVFEAIAARAATLSQAKFAYVTTYDGEWIHLRATFGPDAERLAASYPIRPGGAAISARVVRDRAAVQIEDVLVDPEYAHKDAAKVTGFRGGFGVPMMRDGQVLGAIVVARPEPGKVPEQIVAILQTFADQAVIAIENVRLFNETKEALERQTATAEILRVISSSPTDTAPVFDAIATSCLRLFSGMRVVIVLRRGDVIDRVAYAGAAEEQSTEGLWPLPLDDRVISGRAILRGELVHVPDVQSESWVGARSKEAAARVGYRSIISTPMMREGSAIGAIHVARANAGTFDDKQIALLKTFADQAVIAIENVRLFNETREALEQQTATAEILRVISSTATDTQPVFDAIVDAGLRVFAGAGVGVAIAQGERVRVVAAGGVLGPMATKVDMPRSRESATGAAIVEQTVVNIRDTEAPDAPRYARDNGRALGFRAIAAAPMLREAEAIGAVGVVLREPGGLSDKQLELLRTFADQAVIAIENVRLFKELQARTEALTKSVGQLTALDEVGRAISSTLELEKVLKTIVERAVQLTGLDGGVIYEYDEPREEFRLQATTYLEPELLEVVRREPIRKGDGTVGGTAVTLEPAQVPDILDTGYKSKRKELLIRTGYRAVLTVPLLREDHVIGALSVTRKTPGPFAPEVVGLMKTFATQSAMAIQNAHLFREIAERGRQLEIASRHKSEFLSSMSHELRTPLNAILGFNEMLLGEIYGLVPPDMKEPLSDMQASGKHLLRLINNVLDLAKIEAGRMELALSDYSVQDTVESVRSTLRPLAESKGLALECTVPADIPLAYGDGGRIAQCLMNLAGNSLKFTKAGKVEIAVELKDGSLVYRVADTGVGIPPDKIGSLFTEFKQTDATIASEYGGTGLGLSITKKFIEMHGGRIWVESELGKGSSFMFEIPLRVNS